MKELQPVDKKLFEEAGKFNAHVIDYNRDTLRELHKKLQKGM